MQLLKNDRGATVVEFALVAVPVLWFILAIIEFGYVMWADNLLHVSVDAAARCGAIQSTTPPCAGSGLTNMTTTANTVFGPLSGATFINNGTCTADRGAGIVGTYTINFVFAVNLTLTAQSCYPA
jgi:Flp pilus assembly protein TadG